MAGVIFVVTGVIFRVPSEILELFSMSLFLGIVDKLSEFDL